MREPCGIQDDDANDTPLYRNVKRLIVGISDRFGRGVSGRAFSRSLEKTKG